MAGLLILRGSVEIDMHTERVQDNMKIKAEIFKPRNSKDWQQAISRSERVMELVFTDRPQKKSTLLMPLSHTFVFLDL